MNARKPLALGMLGADLALSLPLSVATGTAVTVACVGYSWVVSAIAAVKVVTR